MVRNIPNDFKNTHDTYNYTDAAKKAMDPSNKTTAGTYNCHVQLLLDYITNEVGVSTSDEKTLINFFTFISNTEGKGYAGNAFCGLSTAQLTRTIRE